MESLHPERKEPLSVLKPERFALHQRVVMRKQPYTLQLDLLDALTGEAVLNFRFEQDPRYHPRWKPARWRPTTVPCSSPWRGSLAVRYGRTAMCWM